MRAFKWEKEIFSSDDVYVFILRTPVILMIEMVEVNGCWNLHILMTSPFGKFEEFVKMDNKEE